MRFGGSGSEQNGWRPGLVFQNNTGNRFSPNIIALPLTSSLKKASQPTHVLLPAEETGLPKDSMVLCENPERMSKEKLGRYLTTLPQSFMAKVAEASLLATSAISYLDLESLVSAWHQACLLNAAG
jgi:mRNA interferase MazF